MYKLDMDSIYPNIRIMECVIVNLLWTADGWGREEMTSKVDTRNPNPGYWSISVANQADTSVMFQLGSPIGCYEYLIIYLLPPFP